MRGWPSRQSGMVRLRQNGMWIRGENMRILNTHVAVFGGWIRIAVGLAPVLVMAASLPAQGQGVVAGIQGVFVGVPLQKVALQGEVAPGTGGASFTSFDEPMINSTGRVAFAANYTGGGGVFLGSGSG